MADPVNLNRARKQKVRAGKKARADANAVKFGRTKVEKLRDEQLAKTDSDKLDGHRIDHSD